MARPGDIYIGISGSEVLVSPGGRKFTRRIVEGAREERSVNGRRVKDILWRKWEFALEYTIIDGTSLREFDMLWNMQSDLSFIWYDADNVENSHTVQMDPYDSTRLVLLGDGLWSGVNFLFHEV